MNIMKYTIERTNELLKVNNYTVEDLVEKQNRVINKLKKKMKIEPRDPYTKEKHPLRVKDFVCIPQSNMPWKLITLQKIDNDGVDNLRFCYYIVSYKILSEKGELQMKYGQFRLNIPIEDYNRLIEKAKLKGII